MRKLGEVSGGRYIQPVVTNQTKVLGWNVVLDDAFVIQADKVEIDTTLKILGVPLIKLLGHRFKA